MGSGEHMFLKQSRRDMQTGFFRLIPAALSSIIQISGLENIPNAEHLRVVGGSDVEAKNAAASPTGVIWSAGWPHANEIIIAIAERALITLSRPACINTQTRSLCAILFSCVFAGPVCGGVVLFAPGAKHLRTVSLLARRKAFDLQTCRCTRRALKLSVRPSISLFVCASDVMRRTQPGKLVLMSF